MKEDKRMDIFEIVSILLGIFVVFRIFSKHSKVLEDKEETKDRNLKYIPPVYTNKKSLNERQKGILKLMNKKKVVLPSEIYDLYPNVSTRTLRRDMDVLVNLHLVRQEGNTKDTKYILNNHIYA